MYADFTITNSDNLHKIGILNEPPDDMVVYSTPPIEGSGCKSEISRVPNEGVPPQ